MMFRLFAKYLDMNKPSTKAGNTAWPSPDGEINKRQQQEENVLDLGFHDLVLKDLVIEKMVENREATIIL